MSVTSTGPFSSTTFTPEPGSTTTYPGYVTGTVVYPPCQRGDPMRGHPHDFTEYSPPLGGPPLLYCRQCGQIIKLEYVE